MAASGRALPDLVARIRVDASGVDSAITALIGSLGKANVAMGAAVAGIGLLVVAGKSMIDIAEKHEKATNSLAQAIAAYNSQLGKTAKAHEEYVKGSIKAKASASELARAHDSVRLATNAVASAQATYNHDLYMYGSQNEKTIKAALSLQDANIRLAAAQRRVADETGYTAGKYVTVAATQARARIEQDRYMRVLDEFIQANRRYISDQSEVIAGAATLLRSGINQAEVQKDLNRALDISSLKHISLSDAVQLLVQAEHGRLRGLIDLGVATTKYTDANGNLIAGSKNVKKAFAEVDKNIKDGRKSLSDQDQALRELGNHYEDFAKGPGKELGRAFTDVLDIVNLFADVFENFQTVLINVGRALRQNLYDPITNFFTAVPSWLLDLLASYVQKSISPSNFTPGGATKESPAMPGQARASGGPMFPNSIYQVGEGGTETVVMGARGGYVIPHGSGGRRGGGMTVLPVVFSPIPPSREQVLYVREQIRRLDREQR